LRAQIPAAVGKPVAGQLESRIAAQPIEIVGILKTAGDREDARAQNVDDAVGIAPVGDLGRQLCANPEAAIGGGQQHDAAIRSDPPAIEGGDHLLAGSSWKSGKAKGSSVSSGMTGVAASIPWSNGVDTHYINWITRLGYIRQPTGE
jgi:hypothetical protein